MTKNPRISPEFPHFPISHPVLLDCHLPISLKIPSISPFPTPHLGAGVLESLTLSKMTESDPKNGKNSWNFVFLDSQPKSFPPDPKKNPPNWLWNVNPFPRVSGYLAFAFVGFLRYIWEFFSVLSLEFLGAFSL